MPRKEVIVLFTDSDLEELGLDSSKITDEQFAEIAEQIRENLFENTIDLLSEVKDAVMMCGIEIPTEKDEE